jgi:uncharacterized membrane protein HdeD (DUF308 family)/predicted flap endonuclease-1-like 5' DNA nuclease
MIMATAATAKKESRFPWWLLLIDGLLAILVGLFLFVYPVKTFVAISFFVGIWWFVSGIFDIVSIFRDRTAWGWKLFMGIVGIVAGWFLFDQVLRGAVTLAYTVAILVGIMGLFYGVLGLIRAFQGEGWGAGILGLISIIFGIFILANPLASALAIPWVFGSLGIVFGFLAVIIAFRLRGEAKKMEAAQAQAPAAPVPTMARTGAAETTAADTAAPAASAPSAGTVAASSVAAGAVMASEARSQEVVQEEVQPAAAEVAVETTAEPVEEAAVVEETTPAVESAPEAAAVETAVAAMAVEETMAEGESTSEAEPSETEAAEPVEAEKVEIPNVVDIPEDQARFLKEDIEYVEGIGPAYGAKLKAVGIMTSLDLLSKGATRKGRELIAEGSGISPKLILEWVNHADLFRLKGVGSEYADLLEEAGVDTVVELAQRNPANLHPKLVEINEQKKLVRQTPSLNQVETWVAEAKQLGRVVQY